MRRWTFVLLLIGLLALTGCGDGDDDKDSTPDQEPSATAFVPTPLPPTWTPSPEGFIASDTPSPTPKEIQGGEPGALSGGSPFPATWTPGRRPSSTPREIASAIPPTDPLAATWTPSPEGFVASDTLSATPKEIQGGEPGALSGGSPFPATWTPGRRPTSTPRYTASPIPPTDRPAATWTPQPDYCYTLQIVSDDVRISVGQDVEVSWTPIERYPDYLFSVRNPSGEIIYQQIAKGVTTMLIPGKTFTNAGGYAWEVWPLDAQGNQVCFPTSRDIIVSF